MHVDFLFFVLFCCCCCCSSPASCFTFDNSNIPLTADGIFYWPASDISNDASDEIVYSGTIKTLIISSASAYPGVTLPTPVPRTTTPEDLTTLPNGTYAPPPYTPSREASTIVGPRTLHVRGQQEEPTTTIALVIINASLMDGVQITLDGVRLGYVRAGSTADATSTGNSQHVVDLRVFSSRIEIRNCQLLERVFDDNDVPAMLLPLPDSDLRAAQRPSFFFSALLLRDSDLVLDSNSLVYDDGSALRSQHALPIYLTHCAIDTHSTRGSISIVNNHIAFPGAALPWQFRTQVANGIWLYRLHSRCDQAESLPIAYQARFRYVNGSSSGENNFKHPTADDPVPEWAPGSPPPMLDVLQISRNTLVNRLANTSSTIRTHFIETSLGYLDQWPFARVRRVEISNNTMVFQDERTESVVADEHDVAWVVGVLFGVGEPFVPSWSILSDIGRLVVVDNVFHHVLRLAPGRRILQIGIVEFGCKDHEDSALMYDALLQNIPLLNASNNRHIGAPIGDVKYCLGVFVRFSGYWKGFFQMQLFSDNSLLCTAALGGAIARVSTRGIANVSLIQLNRNSGTVAYDPEMNLVAEGNRIVIFEAGMYHSKTDEMVGFHHIDLIEISDNSGHVLSVLAAEAICVQLGVPNASYIGALVARRNDFDVASFPKRDRATNNRIESVVGISGGVGRYGAAVGLFFMMGVNSSGEVLVMDNHVILHHGRDAHGSAQAGITFTGALSIFGLESWQICNNNITIIDSYAVTLTDTLGGIQRVGYGVDMDIGRINVSNNQIRLLVRDRRSCGLMGCNGIVFGFGRRAERVPSVVISNNGITVESPTALRSDAQTDPAVFFSGRPAPGEPAAIALCGVRIYFLYQDVDALNMTSMLPSSLAGMRAAGIDPLNPFKSPLPAFTKVTNNVALGTLEISNNAVAVAGMMRCSAVTMMGGGDFSAKHVVINNNNFTVFNAVFSRLNAGIVIEPLVGMMSFYTGDNFDLFGIPYPAGLLKLWYSVRGGVAVHIESLAIEGNRVRLRGGVPGYIMLTGEITIGSLSIDDESLDIDVSSTVTIGDYFAKQYAETQSGFVNGLFTFFYTSVGADEEEQQKQVKKLETVGSSYPNAHNLVQIRGDSVNISIRNMALKCSNAGDGGVRNGGNSERSGEVAALRWITGFSLEQFAREQRRVEIGAQQVQPEQNDPTMSGGFAPLPVLPQRLLFRSENCSVIAPHGPARLLVMTSGYFPTPFCETVIQDSVITLSGGGGEGATPATEQLADISGAHCINRDGNGSSLVLERSNVTFLPIFLDPSKPQMLATASAGQHIAFVNHSFIILNRGIAGGAAAVPFMMVNFYPHFFGAGGSRTTSKLTRFLFHDSELLAPIALAKASVASAVIHPLRISSGDVDPAITDLLDQFRELTATSIYCFLVNGRVVDARSASFFQPLRGPNMKFDRCGLMSQTESPTQSRSEVPVCGPFELADSNSNDISASNVFGINSRFAMTTRGKTKRELLALTTPADFDGNNADSAYPASKHRVVPVTVQPGGAQKNVFTLFRSNVSLRAVSLVDGRFSDNQQQQSPADALSAQQVCDQTTNLHEGFVFSLDPQLGTVLSARITHERSLVLQVKYAVDLDPFENHVVRIAISPKVFACNWDAAALMDAYGKASEFHERFAVLTSSPCAAEQQYWPIARLHLRRKLRGLLPEPVIQTFNTIGDVSGFGTALLSGNAVGMARLNRLRALSQYLGCEFSDVAPLPASQAPLGAFGWGSEVGFFQRGACVGNMLIVLVGFLCLFGPAYRKYRKKFERQKAKLLEELKAKRRRQQPADDPRLRRRNNSSNIDGDGGDNVAFAAAVANLKPKISLLDAMHQFWLPSHASIILMALLQGAVSSATALLRHSGHKNPSDIFLCIVVFAPMLFYLWWFPIAVTVTLKQNPQVSYHEFDEARPRPVAGEEASPMAKQVARKYPRCAWCRVNAMARAGKSAAVYREALAAADAGHDFVDAENTALGDGNSSNSSSSSSSNELAEMVVRQHKPPRAGSNSNNRKPVRDLAVRFSVYDTPPVRLLRWFLALYGEWDEKEPDFEKNKKSFRYWYDSAAYLDDYSYNGRLLVTVEFAICLFTAIMSGLTPDSEANPDACATLGSLVCIVNAVPLFLTCCIPNAFRKRNIKYFYFASGMLLVSNTMAVGSSKVWQPLAEAFLGATEIISLLFEWVCWLKLVVDLGDVFWFIESSWLQMPFLFMSHHLVHRPKRYWFKRKQQRHTISSAMLLGQGSPDDEELLPVVEPQRSSERYCRQEEETAAAAGLWKSRFRNPECWEKV